MLKFKISAKILEDYILRVLKFLNNMTYLFRLLLRISIY